MIILRSLGYRYFIFGLIDISFPIILPMPLHWFADFMFIVRPCYFAGTKIKGYGCTGINHLVF